MEQSPANPKSAKARLVTEIRHYLVITAYLFICFGVIMAYEASQSPSGQDTLWVQLGVALGKAFVLGKFIMIGQALGAGARVRAPSLVHRVTWRTVGVVIVLAVLKLIEEWIVGMVHGASTGELVDELTSQPWLALVAPVLLILLILVPVITASEINRALGPGGLKRLMLESADGRPEGTP